MHAVPGSAAPVEPTSAPRGAGEEAERTWHAELRAAVRDPDALIDRLGLPEAWREGARRSHRLFPVVAPEPLLARIVPGALDDPILRQLLPLAEEEERGPAGYSRDPVGESGAERAPGMLQKYPGRALLILSGVCAVSCRYCFRRHYPYDAAPAGPEAWEPALREIEGSPDLEEVILSGGDPLIHSDRHLGALAARLASIPHLRRLRVHTRLPIVIPARVTAALVEALGGTRLAPTVVVHANHPNELDGACCDALTRLVRGGIPVLNQAVLLRGVNDDAATLAALSRRLLDARALPYYLHQLDPVEGAAHFEVPEEEGRRLVAALRAELPGYGVPTFVREVVGEPSKVPIVGSGPAHGGEGAR
ncbi:MAG: EF-P beta-lysylation protein EpmB [Planctomycetota bacterium]